MVGTLSTITVEPVRFIIAIAYGIKFGAGIVDALLFDKVCLYELGYSQEICENLSSYEDEEIKVQETVNRFNFGLSMANTILSIVSSLLVGGFADRFGLKTTLTVAFLGFYMGDIIDWIFYIFVEDIPLYFLYAKIPFEAMTTGYFIAMYGIINRFVSKDKLATRIGFCDGIYSIGSIIGVLPSAVVFNAIGYIGVYAIAEAGLTLSFLYHLIFIRNTPPWQEEDAEAEKPNDQMENAEKPMFKSMTQRLKAGTIDVVKDLFHTLMKPRAYHMRPLIILIFIAMTFYYMTSNEYSFTYAYMYLMWDITPEQYSLFSSLSSIVTLITLFGLQPLLSQVMKLHDSIILTLGLAICSGLLVLSALAKELIPGFLVVFSILNVRNIYYPSGRALVVKMVDDDEVPKIYGFVNLIWQCGSIIGIPLYRGLYDATLKTFPGAYLMLSACLLMCAAFISFILMTQRDKIEEMNRMKKIAKKGAELEEKKENLPPPYEIDAKIQHIQGSKTPLGLPGTMTPIGIPGNKTPLGIP